MRQVTRLLINDFKIKELGYDFMGFSLQKDKILTYHHLIISHEFCKKNKLGSGYTYENGCVLCSISHEYLHLIERYEEELFWEITSELIDMKFKGKLDLGNILNIWEIIRTFENMHIDDVTDTGKKLIKKEYINRRKIDLL